MPVVLPKSGAGFILRPFTARDVEALAAIEYDPNVKRYLALPTRSRADWVAAFDPDLYGGWAIEVEGILAGRGSVNRTFRKGEGELAVVISRPYWGLKLGRKVAAMLIDIAFAEMNARALVAQVHPDNHASLALLRAFKFRRSRVVSAPGLWQNGHQVYRLSKSSYTRLLMDSPSSGKKLTERMTKE